jgi:hypothetical protein
MTFNATYSEPVLSEIVYQSTFRLRTGFLRWAHSLSPDEHIIFLLYLYGYAVCTMGSQ